MHRTDDEGAVAATACALTAVATAAVESCAAVAVTDPVTDCAFTPGDGATLAMPRARTRRARTLGSKSPEPALWTEPAAAAARTLRPLKVKVTGLAQNLGQLQASNRYFRSNCWASLNLLGQPYIAGSGPMAMTDPGFAEAVAPFFTARVTAKVTELVTAKVRQPPSWPRS